MSQRTVEVVAPSRLHFGLLSFGNQASRQYGGVGVMVERPGLRLRITSSGKFASSGPDQVRIGTLVRRWTTATGRLDLPACHVQLDSKTRLHLGLGFGTQLGLSVAAGLTAFLGLPQPPVVDLAESVGRGLRSAVGTHGFARGGLLYEGGKFPDERISPLETRIALPRDWRFVLVCPRNLRGLHGTAEGQAFCTLPAVATEVSDRLAREVSEQMLPAAASGDFRGFSESVYEYGYQAGLCFAAIQGGAYNGPRLEQIVQRIRDLGVRGVGQSSWGPTIYALCATQNDADDLVQALQGDATTRDAHIWVTATRNSGADVRVIEEEP